MKLVSVFGREDQNLQAATLWKYSAADGSLANRGFVTYGVAGNSSYDKAEAFTRDTSGNIYVAGAAWGGQPLRWRRWDCGS